MLVARVRKSLRGFQHIARFYYHKLFMVGVARLIGPEHRVKRSVRRSYAGDEIAKVFLVQGLALNGVFHVIGIIQLLFLQ